MQNVSHKQTQYDALPLLEGQTVLDPPAPTHDIDQALADLRATGLCILRDALSADEISFYGDKLDTQFAAEQALGAKSPLSDVHGKIVMSNLVNKGRHYLDLVERPELDVLIGGLLGKDWLLSSLTAHLFNAPTAQPQQLHRDQGQVPATVDFPAIVNTFWMLDDYTPERGSTCVVPGSHRWAPEFQVKPPPRELAVQITAPKGSLFVFEGRLWHGTGVSETGHPRRALSVFCCLPWMRQQENAGVSLLQDVYEAASPTLRKRLGFRTYGTLGQINGTHVPVDGPSLGNYDVHMPDAIIGEDGALHILMRVQR